MQQDNFEAPSIHDVINRFSSDPSKGNDEIEEKKKPQGDPRYWHCKYCRIDNEGNLKQCKTCKIPRDPKCMTLGDCETQAICTYLVTGEPGIQQTGFTCSTCVKNDSGYGKICIVCASSCHKNHDWHATGTSSFACVCGDGHCKSLLKDPALLKEDEVHPVLVSDELLAFESIERVTKVESSSKEKLRRRTHK
eukprot:TRINITY_DN6438_c0_g1_i1.p1 TRINITY_DN6438_c0_g1~~TRINITY_DN6438_c0_g1_i1.p1  ORF type:complete len:218 (+),score=22.39 TRINITY_DN6438_c0_g1_i1:77-655(+)